MTDNSSTHHYLEEDIISSGTELLTFLDKGDYQAVDKWFERRPGFFNHPEQSETLFIHVANNARYFSNYPYHLSTEDIHEWIKSRHLALFKHFPFEYQFRYLVCDVHNKRWDIDSDYLAIFNYSPDSQHNVKMLDAFMASEDFGWMIADFFANENFDMLEKIEQIFQVPVMSHPYGAVSITYPDNRHIFQMPESAWTFTACETIMIDYTPEKEAFLTKRGLSLPDAKEAQNFRNKLHASMNCLESYQAPYKNNYLKTLSYIKAYQNRLQYWDLSAKIDSDNVHSDRSSNTRLNLNTQSNHKIKI